MIDGVDMDDLDTRLLVDLLRDRIIPNRNLGQHFLLDESVISRSVELADEAGFPLNENAHVIEVGPGPGSLTLELLRSGATVTGLEIDVEAIAHLNRAFGDGDGRLAIIQGDALKVKWPEKASHLIANLPYQISSPILEKIQQYHVKNPFDVVVLLVQDEFAERMSMDHFGSLSTLGLSLWLDFDVELDRKVPGGAFSPAPRVNSRLVVLNPVNRIEEVGTIDRKMFKIITKHCFASRRKKLRSLLAKPPRRLSRVKGWHKARWNAAMNHIYKNTPEGLDSEWFEERPDVMEPEEWAMIANAISSFEGDF